MAWRSAATSAALDRVVLRALEKEPAARYPDAASLGADLQALQTGAHAGANAEGRAGPSRPWNRTLLYGGAALLLVALLATVGLLARSGGGSGDLDSIAVLPVTNLSGDPEQDYFADGMTDLLINHLARIGGFDRVIARTSVMRYRDTERPLREIGRELGVGALVEASALREGERVRITVNLIEAETERSLWSESFERSVQDVLALQGEMAEAIAREVEVALSPQERAQLETAPTVDPEAFDLYVRGTQARSKLTVDALREAEGYFFRAIAEDPTYAPAYAGLAWVYALSGREGDEARARQHVERALELDPSLAEAHATLGQIRQFYEWDWGGAEEAYRAAIRLNPGFAEAHLELAMLLMRQRRFEEALAAARHALYLAPTSARYQSGLSEVLLYAGRYDEAVASAEEAIALDPSYHTPYSEQAIAYVQQGRYEEALRTWERCAPLGCEDYHTGTIGYTHAVAGQREEARRVLEELVALWEARYGEGHSGAAGVAEAIAAVHVGLGNRQQALDWLERAAQAEKFMVYTAINPVWETLYGEPRFQALLERIGLAE
ncbi:MAG: tetratricopeptide repeat protein [Rhodothermales bacterium]|nr:tetratricopeptide repeat protein [Rhodothermales bacterium]